MEEAKQLILDLIKIDRNIAKLWERSDQIGLDLSPITNQVISGVNICESIAAVIGDDQDVIFELLEKSITLGHSAEETLDLLLDTKGERVV